MVDDSIKARILALMAKTTENGCTEEEALAASQKVQEMLHKYQLDMSDLKLQESECLQSSYSAEQKSDPMVVWCLSAIAYFTDTKVWKSQGEHGWRTYEFFGLEHDVMIAEYITKICDWAIIWGGEDFKKTSEWARADKKQRGRMKQDYQYGMALRLAERLREMKDKQRFEDKQTTGRDLVVVKNAVVEEEFAKLDLDLRKSRGSGRRRVNMGAYQAGRDAGDKVALNPGVSREEAAGHLN